MKPYIVLCVFLMFHACAASDPYCRTFEYDKKLIGNMIRSEFEMETIRKTMKSLQLDIQTMRDELETVRTQLPSAMHPDTTANKDRVAIFEIVTTNIGGGFNKDTGKFTCKQPGLYSFSSVIVRKDGITTSAYCSIMVNDKNTYLFAYAHNVDSSSSPSGSGNLLVQLVEGDEVYLGGCDNIDKFHSASHFSGFLVN